MNRDVKRERQLPTLADVAKLAGVSLATASRALNDRDEVSAETRERVLSAAERLSFRPNSAARNLVSGRSGAIGLVTHDLEGRFSLPVLMGAEDAAGSGRMSVLLCDARGDAIREQVHLDNLLSRRVDGLIVVGARPDPRASLGQLPVPVVYAYSPSRGADDMSVVSDNVTAGRLVAEHLVTFGRARIAIVAGSPEHSAAQDRVAGATAVLRESGLEPVGAAAMFGAWTEEWGRLAVTALLSRFPDVDAVLCGSDLIARGAVEALRELGRRVPDDVAVTGHDNWGIVADSTRPPLTTVDMDLEQLGRHAAARLFEAIDGHATPGVEAIQPRLLPRGSTGPRSAG